MRLLLLGCTGFIGRELLPKLLASDHHLTIVSRKSFQKWNSILPTNNWTGLQLDPANPESWKQESLLLALEKAEGIVNLVGEPIAEKRWTSKHCREIQNSRLSTTNSLVEAMKSLRKAPKVLVNASAIGYYGTSQDASFSEDDKSGKDFLAKLCKKWESIATGKPKSTKLAIIRIGIVLGPDGGALGKMLPVFKAGLGGPIGNGQQWMSWIHRTDLCQIIQEALTKKSCAGVINGVAPEPVAMKEFASTLGKELGRPSLLPIPGPVLKLLLGDGARVVLEGQKVSTKKLLKQGFEFKYPTLVQALKAATNSIQS